MPDNQTRFTPTEARNLFINHMDTCRDLRGARLGQWAADQITNLVQFLVERTTWMTAPASTKYHLSCPAGLVMHSVAVTETALRLAQTLMPDIPRDSVILCAMMHDAGKIYGSTGSDGKLEPRYVPNILAKGNQSEAEPYKYNKESLGMSLTIKDLLVPMKFVDMSDAEMQAILLADGQYVAVNKDSQHEEHPLGLIIHWADYWEGHVQEKGLTANWLGGLLRRF